MLHTFQMYYCPECLKNNVISILETVGKYILVRFCGRDDCYFSQEVKFEIDVTKKKEFRKRKILNDPVINISENHFNDEDDDSADIQIKACTTVITRQRLMKMIKTSGRTDVIFNWMSLPTVLDFSAKVCYFLIIHLNIVIPLKEEDLDPFVMQLKELYLECQEIFKGIPIHLVRIYAFDFANLLFEGQSRFSGKNMNKNLDIGLRILDGLSGFFATINTLNHRNIRTILDYDVKCDSCSFENHYSNEVFYLNLPRNYVKDRNAFCYKSICDHCFGDCRTIVRITRLSDFLIIYLPRGTNSEFIEFNSIVFEGTENNNFTLQTVLECNYKSSMIANNDLPKQPHLDEFVLSVTIKQQYPFRIHLKNYYDGWFSINELSGNVVKSISDNELKLKTDDIRLLVYTANNIGVNDNKCSAVQTVRNRISVKMSKLVRSPHPVIDYPSADFRYWSHLWKCLDICLEQSSLSVTFVKEVVKELMKKLNSDIQKPYKDDDTNEDSSQVKINRQKRKYALGRRLNANLLVSNQKTSRPRRKKNSKRHHKFSKKYVEDKGITITTSSSLNESVEQSKSFTNSDGIQKMFQTAVRSESDVIDALIQKKKDVVESKSENPISKK